MRQTAQPSFQKKQALDAFRKAPERQVLAGTPLFQRLNYSPKIKRNVLSMLILLALCGSASAQLVIDKKAIAKSGENIAMNVIKQQHYKKIRDFTEENLR